MTTSTASRVQPTLRDDDVPHVYDVFLYELGPDRPLRVEGRLKNIPGHVMFMAGSTPVWSAPSESVMYSEIVG